MFLWINSIFFSVSFCFQFLSMSGTYSFLFSFYIVPFPLLLLYKILQCFGKIFWRSECCIFFKIFKRTPCTSKFIKNKKKINIIQNRRTINTKTQKLQKNIYFVSYRKKTHTINKHTINTIQKLTTRTTTIPPTTIPPTKIPSTTIPKNNFLPLFIFFDLLHSTGCSYTTCNRHSISFLARNSSSTSSTFSIGNCSTVTGSIS